MTKPDIDQISSKIAAHSRWLRGETNGECADFSNADLSGANFSYCFLSKANFSNSILRDCNFMESDLCDCNFSNADLGYANFDDANLIGANFRHANCQDAFFALATLVDADLGGANLSGANFYCAVVSRTNLSGAHGLPGIVPFDINRAMSEACAWAGALQMGRWHTNENTHGRDGWAVVLHPQGRELERKYGTTAAAAFIYNACAGFVPDFYASNEEAMKDIVEKAR